VTSRAEIERSPESSLARARVDSSSAGRLTSLGARGAVQLNIVLPGSYAWFTTVAWPSVTGGASVSAKAASGAALLMLVLGARLAATAHRWAAPVGIVGFFVGCVAAWQLAGRQLSGAAVDPFGATLGGIGWVLFVHLCRPATSPATARGFRGSSGPAARSRADRARYWPWLWQQHASCCIWAGG